MTVVEELRYRIDCVRRGTPDGWGEVHSLDIFVGVRVADRLFCVQPLFEDEDPAEYNELCKLRDEAKALIKEKRS